MSSRIPVDQFGSSISGSVSAPGKKADCATKKYVDNLGVRRNPENDIILETQGNFILKNPVSNGIKFYINDDKIHCNSKRLTDLLPPVNNNDASTKDYVDGRIAETKAIFSTYVQGSMLTIKFDLSRMAPSTVHRLSDPSERTFFVLAHRFKTRNNLWDARDQPKVKITVKDNFLHIQKKDLFPTGELTGVGEVLLIRGSDPIDIADLQSPNIGVAGIN